jgi:hypothetical protein
MPFPSRMTRLDASYSPVTALTTVGFSDIAARAAWARR